MDQLLLQKLRQRRDELREIVRKKKVSVKKAPAGCFKYTRRKNSFEYYWKAPGAQRYSYIPKENSKLAAELAQKSYDEKVLKAASKELKLIDKLIKACGKNEIEDAYDKCPEPRKILIKPVKPSDDEFREEWNKQPSCLLGFGENDPEFGEDGRPGLCGAQSAKDQRISQVGIRHWRDFAPDFRVREPADQYRSDQKDGEALLFVKERGLSIG